MLVYRFLEIKFALKSIKERRLKISRINELNDPFELLPVELSNPDTRKWLQKVKEVINGRNGIICFCKDWHNPLMWGHYTNKHQGLCLGFDIPQDRLIKVEYIKQRLSPPSQSELDENFARKLLGSKFKHWYYEKEYRVFPCLSDIEEDGYYYCEFSNELMLKQIIIGSECKSTRDEIFGTLNENKKVKVIQATPDLKLFKIVEAKT